METDVSGLGGGGLRGGGESRVDDYITGSALGGELLEAESI